MKIVTLAVAVLIAGSSFALAQESTAPPQGNTKTPVITKRQVNQRARIRQGVKSGELTKGETAKLRQEQRDIRADKKMAKSDGKVTPAERRHITKEQNKASKDIYRLKHNAREKAK
jgi:hypothetical protein